MVDEDFFANVGKFCLVAVLTVTGAVVNVEIGLLTVVDTGLIIVLVVVAGDVFINRTFFLDLALSGGNLSTLDDELLREVLPPLAQL